MVADLVSMMPDFAGNENPLIEDEAENWDFVSNGFGMIRGVCEVFDCFGKSLGCKITETVLVFC